MIIIGFRYDFSRDTNPNDYFIGWSFHQQDIYSFIKLILLFIIMINGFSKMVSYAVGRMLRDTGLGIEYSIIIAMDTYGS